MKYDGLKWITQGFTWREKLILLFVFLLFVPKLRAQHKEMDFPATDSLTLKYYLSGQWDSLLMVGKASGLDYYWLNARMGYAWFAKGKYGRAIRQFRKALRNNASDAFSLEYYAYSALYMGFNEQTLAALGAFQPTIPDRLRSLNPYPLSAAGGGMLMSNASIVLTGPALDENANIYGEASLPGDGRYFFGYGALALAKRLIITPGVSFLKTNNPFRAATADSFLFATDNSYRESNFHLSMAWVPSLTWTLHSYFRLSGFNYDYSAVEYDIATNTYSLSPKNKKITDYAAGLGITHYFGDIALSADACWHTEYDSAYAQAGILFNWYPFSDTRLIYGVGIYAGLTNRNPGLAVVQSLSLNLHKGLWLTGALTLGESAHKSFADAWIIYNADHTINRITTLSVFFNLTQSLSASLQWNNLKCSGQGLYYPSFSETSLQNFDYYKNSLSISIYWKW